MYDDHMTRTHDANDERKIMNMTAKGIEGSDVTYTLQQLIDMHKQQQRWEFGSVDEAEAIVNACIEFVVAQMHGEWCDYVARNSDGTFTCMLVHSQEEVTITFKK